MGLHRLLVPAVGIAGSLATAMSCTNMTVHAAEESMPKLYKPSEVRTFMISSTLFSLMMYFVERGSSAVECRTRNKESPGLNPLCYRFKVWAFSFSPRCPSSLVVHNCCVDRMVPREAELVSE